MQAMPVTLQILNGLTDAFKKEGKPVNVEIVSSFCMFAGIASILLWDKDWSSLKNKGIYESLIEPKGIDAIDDFAMELMGFEDINYSTSKEAMRMKIIGQYSNAVAMKFTEKNLGKIEQYQQIIIAMFNFGIAYGAELLGMR